MTPQEFIHKWQRANLSERSAYQQHFLDLCELLGQPKPAEVDADGSSYTFERGVHKTDGSRGWADVWMKGHFAFEYKKKHRDLGEAYKQLQHYREDLENPPLLIVCDLDRFEIHTNFTNTPKEVHKFALLNVGDKATLELLKNVFTDPDKLRPGKTTDEITQEIAEKFAELADNMRSRLVSQSAGVSPVPKDTQADAHRVAHFLMKLMFCMFAEDIELLPGKLFDRTLTQSRRDPSGLSRRLRNLFQAMATGGEFGADVIRHFNGGLFADADVIDLTWDEIETLILVNAKDWSNVEPSIFGTLFERTLDPAKRSQIGAHYTSRADILTLLEPVLMAPLRREWEEVKAKCAELAAKLQEAVRGKAKKGQAARHSKAIEKKLMDFLHRLAEVKILDPACGSGNFLYVAINLLLDLEKQVIAFASQYGFSWFPHVRPTQLLGIEINPFAQELAQVVIWIGYLQWMLQNGFSAISEPVLEPFENIKNMDAILDLGNPEHPKEPEWPAAEFIVGNPPFLGSKLLRRKLGDSYVESLFEVYDDRVKRNADLCVYWFERARVALSTSARTRVGLLATQGIRGKASRQTLERIKDSGDIFFGISDRPWILEGAMVHVSMIGFDNGVEDLRILDDKRVNAIHADLESGVDVTKARRLSANIGRAFQGVTPMGSFDIESRIARKMLGAPNPSGQPNSSVIRRWANGKDLIEGKTDEWVIDFGCGTSQEEASRYEEPFEYTKAKILPERQKGQTEEAVDIFWLHWRPRPELRGAIEGCELERYLVTPRVAKHRLFIWIGQDWLPSDATIAFAVATDYEFGVRHSRIHELRARRKGTQLREYESGFRYIHEECFETFPFPNATPDQQASIADAASKLDTLRTNWLNPSEWTKQEVLEFPGSSSGPWSRYVHDPDERGIGTVRYPRLVPKDEILAKSLAKRTLTNLYNERPTWLDLAHKKLDAAVAAAYGWPAAMGEEEILESLLGLNLERAGRT